MIIVTYTIYADLYLLLNAVVDFIIFHTASRLTGVKVPLWRLVIASLAGSFYALGSLFLPLAPVYTALVKIGFLLVMILVAFGRRPLSVYLPAFLWVNALSMVVAGMALIINYLGYSSALAGVGQPSATAGAVLVSAAFLALGAALVWRFLQARQCLGPNLLPVEIRVDGRKLTVIGLVDTGNSVSDPLTGLPAILVEFEAIRDVFPAGLHRLFGGHGPQPDPAQLAQMVSNDPLWATRFRMLPCASMTGGRRLIPGFSPDALLVKGERQGVVGVIPGRLDNGGGYQALINPRLLSAGDQFAASSVAPGRVSSGGGLKSMI